MMNTDDLILETINASGALEDGEMVTEAILVFSTVLAANESAHGYGKVFLGGSMPHHHALGLVEVLRCQLIDGEE